MRKFLLLLIATALFSCNDKTKSTTGTGFKDSTALSPKTDSTVTNNNVDTVILKSIGNEVLSCLSKKDFGCLAEFVHPTEGIRFSPYVYADTATNKHFTKEEVSGFAKETKKINWGPYDAGEEEIIFTPKQYFEKFVYDLDFSKASITLNKNISHGTMPNNLETIYTSHQFIEYFIPGVDPKFDGMDWRSLHLIFKNENGKLYLVGIAHGQWTT